MAIKSMIRLNQIKDQKSELEAHVLADLQTNAVSSGDGQDGLEFTLLKFMEGLQHRLGSTAVGSNGLWDGQGGSSGVVASFSADDAIDRVVINQSYASNASGLDITSAGQGPSAATPALKIDASDAAGYLYVKSAGQMELESTSNMTIDVDAELIMTVASDKSVTVSGDRADIVQGEHTEAITGAYTGTTGGAYSQIGGNTVLLQSSAETVTIDAAADAKDLKLSAGNTAEAHIQMRYDTGATRSEVEVQGAAIQLWNGSGNPATVLDIDAADMNLDGATFDLTLSGAETHSVGGAYSNTVSGTTTFESTGNFIVNGSADIDLNADSDVFVDAAASIAMRADAGTAEYSHGDMSTALGGGSRLSGPALDLQSSLSGILMSGVADNGDFATQNSGNLFISALFENTNSDMVQNGSTASEMTNGANEYLSADFDQLSNVQGLIFGDAHCVASNWSIEGIPLAVHTGEWNAFRDAFGEVSLLNAMAQAGAGASDAGVYQISIGGDIPVASALFEEGGAGNEYSAAAYHAQASAVQIDGREISAASAFIPLAANTDFDELMERLSIFCNGQRLLPSYYDGSAVEAQDFTVKIIEATNDIAELDGAQARSANAAKLAIDVLFDLESGDELVVIIK